MTFKMPKLAPQANGEGHVGQKGSQMVGRDRRGPTPPSSPLIHSFSSTDLSSLSRLGREFCKYPLANGPAKRA